LSKKEANFLTGNSPKIYKNISVFNDIVRMKYQFIESSCAHGYFGFNYGPCSNYCVTDPSILVFDIEDEILPFVDRKEIAQRRRMDY